MGLVVLAAGPASAQRDPFDPATGPSDSGQEESTEGGVFEEPQDDSQGAAEEPAPDENGSDVLANTGADVSGWLVLAYGLMVAGLGAVVVGRTWRPQTSSR